MVARHEILSGRVQLYQRANSPFWQCSASVGGQQLRTSTKTDSLSQAKDFAEDWYLTLKGKDRFGGGLPQGKKFRIASALFLEEYKALMAKERSPRHTYICLRLMEGADIYQVAKNCRTSVEMIEKYYASHINNMLDASAINVRRIKTGTIQAAGTLTAEED